MLDDAGENSSSDSTGVALNDSNNYDISGVLGTKVIAGAQGGSSVVDEAGGAEDLKELFFSGCSMTIKSID